MQTLNVTGNINADCEISGSDALALVKYFTPTAWPLCGSLLNGTVWNGCGLNMICSGNLSTDKCMPPSGLTALDVDMNGYVSLSDLNILMSFVARRTNLLSNITIQTPGNLDELSIFMQFISADMTWPSSAAMFVQVELGVSTNDHWTCTSGMPLTPSSNGVVIDAVFIGNGSWNVRASNFSKTLRDLGVIIMSQTTSSGSTFTNVML